MKNLTTQIRNAVDKPEVNLGIGSFRPEGCAFERNFSNKENVLLCLDLIDQKFESIQDIAKRAGGKLGCGSTIGHGESCAKGWLCRSCSALEMVISELKIITDRA